MPTRLSIQNIEKEYTQANQSLLHLNDSFQNRKFSLPMPPPNITGRLHLGHALDLNLQDTCIRWYAQRSATTTWTPGSDHAGIATHEKILDAYPQFQGHNLNPYSSNAHELELYNQYMDAAHKWRHTHQDIIFNQFGALHPYTSLASPRFTLDDKYLETTRSHLKSLKERLYWKEGHLYINLQDINALLQQAINNKTIRCEPYGQSQKLLAMLREEREWDIGRTIPWGTPIPEWCYSLPGANRDNLTLDTWFNSSLWPNAITFEEHTPFNALITGYDIALFWGARMCMMHYALFNCWPFHEIRLHGLIRDEQGRKFSKSLGNGIDPLDIIHNEGSDALRIWCLENAAWGRDLRCKREDFTKMNTLPTKLLNATRWILMKKPEGIDISKKTENEWIFPETDSELLGYMENYELDKAWIMMKRAARELWCEGWLMKNKELINTEEGYLKILHLHQQWLIRLHPFMPMTTWWLYQKTK